MQRRSFIATAGLTAVTLSTGCVDSLQATFSQPPRLGWLAVSNYSHEPHRFQIQLERDGELLHDSTHQLEGYPYKSGSDTVSIPGEVVECTWGDVRGPFTLRGRVDETEWVEQSIDEDLSSVEGTPDCVIADAEYGSVYSKDLVFQVQDWCGSVPGYEGGCSFANSDS